MLERLESRLLIRAGLCAWLLAAGAAAWEVLAQQAPDSPLHLGVLAGPVGQLRDHALALGGGLLGGGLLWPWLYERGQGRPAFLALLSGSAVTLAALGYGAVHGLIGVQVFDPRADVRWLVIARAAGHLLLSLALVNATWRALRR